MFLCISFAVQVDADTPYRECCSTFSNDSGIAILPTDRYLLIRILPQHVLVIIPTNLSENFPFSSVSFFLLFLQVVLDWAQVVLTTRKRNARWFYFRMALSTLLKSTMSKRPV